MIKELNDNKRKQNYIENSIARIQAYIAGMCIGSNLKGLGGREFHYDDGERGRNEITKEIKKLVKYLTKE